MRAFLYLLALLAVMAVPGHVRADTHDDEEQLRKFELDCATALVSGDTQWLSSFYDQDWILVGSDGNRYTRKQTLAPLADGSLKWVSCVFSDWDVHVFGDTAIVIYKAVSLGEINRAKIDETEICSDTFVRVDDKWHCVHSHNSRLP